MEIQPVPYEFKSARIIDVRWTMYKNFLEERGKDYRQVFLTDTRDVIFQDDLFVPYKTTENFLLYSEEWTSLKDNPATSNWIIHLYGKDEVEHIKDCQVICCGTVLGTVDEIKIFCDKMIDELKRSTAWGDEQAAMNYLVYEKLLPIENIFASSTTSGDIFTPSQMKDLFCAVTAESLRLFTNTTDTRHLFNSSINFTVTEIFKLTKILPIRAVCLNKLFIWQKSEELMTPINFSPNIYSAEISADISTT